MKSELRVSDLIEDASYGLVGISDITASILSRDLKESVKFYIGKFEEVFPTALGMTVKDFPVGLPFENTYIEWLYSTSKGHMRLSALIQMHEGDFCGEVFFAPSATSRMQISGMHFIHRDGEIASDRMTTVFSSAGREPTVDDRELVRMVCAISMHIVNIMNCSNISFVDGGRSGVNRLRGSKSKKKLYSYKTLVLDVGERKVVGHAGTGKHASPRIHLRRGHVRRLPTGGTTWVQPCVVGNKENGIVHKDYKLTNSQLA